MVSLPSRPVKLKGPVLTQSPDFLAPSRRLTDAAVFTMLEAARAEALRIGQPQCIVIVDASVVELASLRMLGAKVLSLRSARAKAMTAASTGRPSTAVAEAVREQIALATEGAMTGLPGGLPILFDGAILGGIGVGSGSGAQDVEVARAALAAIGADPVS
ncbi:MAG: heme-binding protein [Paracoccaceae bacterium]|nr:heme-binding protein [Paracoccaceae bacterium]